MRGTLQFMPRQLPGTGAAPLRIALIAIPSGMAAIVALMLLNLSCRTGILAAHRDDYVRAEFVVDRIYQTNDGEQLHGYVQPQGIEEVTRRIPPQFQVYSSPTAIIGETRLPEKLAERRVPVWYDLENNFFSIDSRMVYLSEWEVLPDWFDVARIAAIQLIIAAPAFFGLRWTLRQLKRRIRFHKPIRAET